MRSNLSAPFQNRLQAGRLDGCQAAMLRQLINFQDRLFDIVVIGGGIHGACVAWDASLRGLSVALVEKADFGHAASSNSLKIMHGGLRYLQEINVPRMRTMIRERRAWLRIAPRLVRPLPFILPTARRWARHKAAMRAALTVNDLVSYDRNHGLQPESRIPRGRILSRKECLKLIPQFPSEGLTGGALWYDAQLVNSERLLLSILQSAVGCGAAIANYAEATGLRRSERRRLHLEVRDGLSGSRFSISSRLIVNCTGAWSEEVLGLVDGLKSAPKFRPSLAVNLVVRQIVPDLAVGLPSRFAGRERILFMTPWQGYSLVGTWHSPVVDSSSPERLVSEAAIREWLNEINAALPAADLARGDVHHVHAGFLPAHACPSRQGSVRLKRESAVYDHAHFSDFSEMITVHGVKYTTARHTAERVVDLALRKLGRRNVACRTAQTVVAGAATGVEPIPTALDGKPLNPVSPETLQWLSQEYGESCSRLLALFTENPRWAEPLSQNHRLIGAEVIHAIRCEMAQTLTDFVRRRSSLGAAGPPDECVVRQCVRIMAQELGWTAARQADEIGGLSASYNAGSIRRKLESLKRAEEQTSEKGIAPIRMEQG